ncbi:MAG: hypothetical protein JNN29_09695 [Chitinophagaceae bacterium]|nr:hypothetical protein [Chitinophagaceae bacterium]
MKKTLLTLLTLLTGLYPVYAQMITGVWKGKINRQQVEIKIIQQGDSLTGTSYYYTSPTQYRRYAIKGFFDASTNETVWWDDQLIEEKTGRGLSLRPGQTPNLARADFNCPGEGIMKLDGKVVERDEPEKDRGDVHLNKTASASFFDEWDYVIDNFTIGANDPWIIDSIASIAKAPPAPMPEPQRSPVPPPVITETLPEKKPEPVVVKTAPKPQPIVTIEDKYFQRKKEYSLEIPVTGDSIELKFYDNAQIDGDSISLFLNDRLVFEHIRLSAVAHTIRIAVADLKESNDLVMVAENLGEIPPNTSYMIALVNNRRYEAMLSSTEQTSAAIKLVKPATPLAGQK